jgi:uncharacterized membrane protein
VAFYDWLLFLHIASAFALVAALVVFWTVAVAGRNVDQPSESLRLFKVARPANVLVAVGTIGTLIFGIWLAINSDAYHPWDWWVLLAIVLWAVSGATGQRGGQTYAEARKFAAELDAGGRGNEPSTELQLRLQDRRAMWLNIVSTVAVLAILVIMIYKPGA